jgi:hypothetical protein
MSYADYRLGILRAAESLIHGYDQPSMAGWIIASQLQGESESALRKQCRAEGVKLPRGFWQAEVRPHNLLRPTPDGEKGTPR